MKFPCLLFLLFSTYASADEVFVNYGIGLGESAVNSMVETKMIDFGYRDFLYNGFYWQNTLGYYGDGSGNPQRKSSFYGSTGFGLEVDIHPVELHSGWALAAISTPDIYLGGNLPMFNGNLGVNIRDKHQNGIGLTYSHISSAGLVQPNQGRDFLTLELSFKW